MKIRLPAALKSQIEAAATENQRSLNAEIINRLEGSFFVDSDVQITVENLREISERTQRLESKVDKALQLVLARKAIKK